MVNKRLVIGAIIGVFVLCAGGVRGQEGDQDLFEELREDTTTVVIDGTVHTPAEILKIMDRSNIVYTLDLLPEDTVLDEDEPIIDGYYQRRENGDEVTLHISVDSDTATALLHAAEDAFVNEDYATALSFFRQTVEQDSSFANGWALMGNTFYFMGQYDSAVFALEKAIANNYISYETHGFLAAAYWKSGEQLKALEEYTISHLLNRNQVVAKLMLIKRRMEVQQPWEEWEFTPEYILIRNNEQHITIRAKSKWVWYAAAKALWKYEPGYREKMTGSIADSTSTNTIEERECLVMLLPFADQFPRVIEAVEEGYIDEFIMYEIWARKYPLSVLILPDIEEWMKRLVVYVNKFH